MALQSYVDVLGRALYIRGVNRAKWFRQTYLVSNALNLPVAIGVALVLYSFFGTSMDPETDGGSVARYYIFKASLRIGDFLHLTPASKTHYYFGDDWGQLTRFTFSILSIYLSIACAAILLYSALKRLKAEDTRRGPLRALVGLIALMAVPAAGVLATRWLSFSPVIAEQPQWTDPPLRIWLGELCSLLFVYAVSAKRKLSIRVAMPLVLIHCTFWLLAFFGPYDHMFFRAMPLVFIFPIASLSWLFIGDSEPGSQARNSRLLTVFALASCSLLAVIWIPWSWHSQKSLLDSKSLSIALSRTQCFGRCPIYELAVNRDGSVNYKGEHYVRVKGRVDSQISPEKVRQLVEYVEQADLFSLDDRAFDRCFDTPFLSLSVVSDGKQKTIWSDAHCAGPRNSPQRSAVQLARAIDEITESKKWVECEGRCDQ